MVELTQDQKLALARAKTLTRRRMLARQTNVVEQAGTGANEGIASMAGLPVDAVTGGLNWLGDKTGMWGPIENPVGGSESVRGLLDPFMSDDEPMTAVQRIARRIGQDVGAGAVAGPLAGVASPGAAALNTAASAVSGASGGAAAEMGAPPAVQDIVSLLAGMGTAGGAVAMRPGPRAPSLDEIRRGRDAAYQTVRESDATVGPEGLSRLKLGVQREMAKADADEILHPKATRAAERLRELDEPTIGKIDQRRQYIGADVAGASDAGERRIGYKLKDEIDRFLGTLRPEEMRGGGADEVVSALERGRALHAKAKKAETLETAIAKAERRAATSGTGGNAINTTRQNLRAILDDPRKARQFSEGERKVIESIVMGSPTANASRMFGRLAPSSGALPFMTTGWGAAAATAASGNPLPMLPGTIGFAAKALGETLTDRQVKKLSEIVRNGGPVDPKRLTDGERAVLKALAASSMAE